MKKTPSFEDLALPKELVDVLGEQGYDTPTPIQAQSIPLLLKGKDIIGQSRTGTGKTAAFALPILARVRLPGRRLQAVIMCPTRELCAQVAREFRKLGSRLPGLQVLVLSGGQPIRPQLFALEKGAHIAVGTPGRILDHLSRGKLNLEKVRAVVLDEADRMLDMGFEEDMEHILGAMPKTRQTVLFSATFPQSIESMSERYQHEPMRIAVKSDEKGEPAIRQIAYEVAPDKKVEALIQVLKSEQPQSALVFCNFKIGVANVVDALTEAGVSCGAIHGDLEQYDRDKMMAKFRNRSVRVLVATDVAARGIDVESLDLVVNLDLPSKPETYVHRIGRSGRAGKTGMAIAFATSRESFKIEGIETFTGITIEKRSLASMAAVVAAQAKDATDTHSLAAMVTFSIGAGRKEKLRPGDILGALTGDAAGLSGDQVGKIEIHDHFAYVAVAQEVAETALHRLQDGKIKGRKFMIKRVH